MPCHHRAARQLFALCIACAAHAQDAEVGRSFRQVITDSPVGTRDLGGAVRVESVTPEDARAWQAVRLSDALEYTPGLRLDVTCQNCNATEIRLLGLPQRYLALLQDGLPTQSGLASTYGLDQIPIGLVERIDVVKGPGTTPRAHARRRPKRRRVLRRRQGYQRQPLPNVDVHQLRSLEGSQAHRHATARQRGNAFRQAVGRCEPVARRRQRGQCRLVPGLVLDHRSQQAGAVEEVPHGRPSLGLRSAAYRRDARS